MKHPYVFGGQFMPEILMTPIQTLSNNWKALRDQADFKNELDFFLKIMQEDLLH